MKPSPKVLKKLKSLYDEALTYQNMGQLKQAEKKYRAILTHKSRPQIPEVYVNLGAICANTGRHQEAVTYFNSAVERAPHDLDALCNLALSQGEIGRHDLALNNYRKALSLSPNNIEILCSVGLELNEMENYDEASEILQQAIDINPKHARSHYNLAIAFSGLGNTPQAIEHYRITIACDDQYAPSYYNLGNALKKQEQFDTALECYNQAILLKPDFADAYNNRGDVLSQLRQFDAALESYNQAIQVKPDCATAYSSLGEIYENKNMVHELKQTVLKAQKTLPENEPNLLYIMALLANREKRFEDARNLLELITAEELKQMSSGCSVLLAKTYDRLGQFNDAFAQFETTNKIAELSIKTKPASERYYFDWVRGLSKSWSDTGRIEWSPGQASANGHSIVFLVGFPRSGTTLLDTIMRSHPELFVVEEKPMVNAMRMRLKDIATAEHLTGLDDSQIADLRKVYFKELYSHVDPNGAYKVIIDKLPLNSISAGLIHRVLPDSKFILSVRHPYDCVLSCFMQNFRLNASMENFLTLQQSARLYDAVMELWFHYNKALDLKVSTVKYEDLVLDLRDTLEPLLNFLGLVWHDNLLDYQKTALSREMINTPSYNQVTQDLYTHAIGRWKHYQDHMQGVIPLLEPWAKKFGYADISRTP